MTVAVYARASQDRTELRISTDRQLARCVEHAKTVFPGQPVATFADNNLTASDPEVERPEFNRLIAAIRSGEITGVVAHEQSRLTRLPPQWDELVVVLSRAGITEVHTVLKGVVSVAPGNRLVGRIMTIIDANESEVIKLRATAMHEHLAAQGRPNGGRYYGYRRQIGPDGRPQLVVYEPEAVVVRRIVAELLAGMSTHQVADRLAAEGVPTGRAGRRWWDTTVMAVARRPHIAGLRTFRGNVVGPGTWEPIVEREQWEQARAVLAGRTTVNNAGRSRRWLLSGGIAVCGNCAAPLVVAVQPRRVGHVHAYVCSKRSRTVSACGVVSVSPAEMVEQLVTGAVLDALDSPAAAALLHPAEAGVRSGLVAQLAEAEARVARAAELFGAGEVDELTWRRMHAPARAGAEDARKRLGALSPVLLPPAEGVRASWPDLPLAQRRAVVWALVEAVVISPRTGRRPADHKVRVAERVTIRWR